jgi:hypothetical protein
LETRGFSIDPAPQDFLKPAMSSTFSGQLAGRFRPGVANFQSTVTAVLPPRDARLRRQKQIDYIYIKTGLGRLAT